jgi:Fe-S oxidoreductase
MVGELENVQEFARKFKAAAAATKCRQLVVLDPADARILQADYPRWDCIIDGEIHTATSFVADLLEKGKLKIKNKRNDLTITYHDPCRLARDLDETEPARKTISALGVNFKEIFLNKNNTKCCGGVNLASHTPEYTVMTARARLEQAEATNAKMLLVSCPGCYDIFNSGRMQDSIEVQDLFVLLNENT